MIPVVKSKRTVMLRQQGLSLVELMVALVIALILTAGVIQIFLGSNQTYRVNEGMSRVQENVRFGMDVLQRDIRMAGFSGCSKNIMNHLDPTVPGFVPSLMSGIAVMGWEFGGTQPGDTYGIGDPGGWTNGSLDPLPADVAANALPGSDILVINRAERADVELSGNPHSNAQTIGLLSASGIEQDTLVMVVSGNCGAGDFWQKANAKTASTITKSGSGLNQNPPAIFRGAPYGDDASVYIWSSVAYYVGTGASDEPALFQQRLDTGGDVGETLELVESVENMQILYGVDTSGNQRVDRYDTAAAVTDWDEVISVRLALLLRTANEPNPETDTRSYTLIGTVVDPVDDRRLRQVSTTTIGVRNRLD